MLLLLGLCSSKPRRAVLSSRSVVVEERVGLRDTARAAIRGGREAGGGAGGEGDRRRCTPLLPRRTHARAREASRGGGGADRPVTDTGIQIMPIHIVYDDDTVFLAASCEMHGCSAPAAAGPLLSFAAADAAAAVAAAMTTPANPPPPQRATHCRSR